MKMSNGWKNLRTLVVALTATGCFVGAAIFSFDVNPRELWEYFTLSVMMLGFVVASAFVVVMLINLLRRS